MNSSVLNCQQNLNKRVIMKLTVGFIGLGAMGLPMSLNLLKSGFKVQGCDRDMPNEFSKQGGIVCRHPKEVAQNAHFVISMLPNGEIVKDVFFGTNGLCETITSSTLVIDMSTIHPLDNQDVRKRFEDMGIEMMDAPVGRTSAHAKTGELLILAGGTSKQIQKAQIIFDVLGDQTIDCGGNGKGIGVKIINNSMSIVLNALNAEIMTLCEKMDIDLDKAIEVMKGTPAIKSHLTTSYVNKAFKGDLSPNFMLKLAHKDLDIALDVAQKLEIGLPLSSIAQEDYIKALEANLGDLDWSALYEFKRQNAGLKPKVNLK